MSSVRLLIVLLVLSSSSPAPAKTPSSASAERVILVHGLGRGKSLLTPMKERLAKEGYAVSVVEYRSLGRTPDQILHDAAQQMARFNSDTAAPVHFVGHSLGGLVIRAYLDSVRPTNLGRVVLIGSPNHGTPFVDRFRDAWWLKLAGAAARSLGTDSAGFPQHLRPPYYPVGVIAGSVRPFDNDEFVPGEDDGIVPVESAKVEGMSDFILLNISHSSLPRREETFVHVLSFLRTGRFVH